jgi:uncharacterized protein (UPF0332 family)
LKEIRSLIDRADKYIKSAGKLIEEEDYESSVSRSYYAMFYCTEALLLTEGLSYSSHKGVISAFGKHFVKTGIFDKAMSRELNRAFEKRQLSDYEYTFVIDPEEAKELLESAKAFTEQIKAFLNTKNYLSE